MIAVLATCGLAEKQNAVGVMQLIAAIAVVHAAQEELAAERSGETGRAPLLGWAKTIEHFARSDAGRKIAAPHNRLRQTPHSPSSRP